VTNRDALGGNYFAVARLEAEFPLGLPEEYGITGGLFADVGSVWGLDNTLGVPVDDKLHLRSAIGFSIFWTTPIGPLRFNFSRAIKKESYDKEQNFDLTISTKF
jgi:outer membrane protein insertion porin family